MLPSVPARFFVSRDNARAWFLAEGCRSARQKSIGHGERAHAETEGVTGVGLEAERPFGGLVRDCSTLGLGAPVC